MRNYDKLPNPAMAVGLRRYFERGVEPGGFLAAVLSNDLRRACERADDDNIHLLVDHVRWLYNEAPAESWGSAENVARWLACGGLEGLHKAAIERDEAREAAP